MLTLLREGESVINGRPLTYVSDDPDETTAIIPAHFIQDTRGTELHDLDITDAKFLLKNVRYLQNVRDSLKDQITKRLNWPLGRVIELYPGKEGIEKVSKLRVANGFAIRPLQRLYPLEMSVSDLPSDIALARATIDLLKDTFGDRLISRFGPVNWPPRSCDLTPLDYFLWGYVKSLVYADKPQTLDHLEDNIRRVIADIRPQMLEKVIENWTSRLDYIRASRGNHMPEIIFKI
ncbi:DUF5641 domain-containing protein [Trichonephila clavipes]|nr:DUF5641 domain-containing protein [Trichonephila clavipes]